jgi:hypothetical protein
MSANTQTDDGGDDPERALLNKSILRDEAYASACRARMWQIGVPLVATLACVLCLYVCEDCLIGVMIFCVALGFRDCVLVLVFVTSLVLLIARHPMDTKTVTWIAKTGYTIVKTD